MKIICQECRESLAFDPSKPQFAGLNKRHASFGSFRPLCLSCPDFTIPDETEPPETFIYYDPLPKEITMLKAQVRYLLKKQYEKPVKKKYVIK